MLKRKPKVTAVVAAALVASCIGVPAAVADGYPAYDSSSLDDSDVAALTHSYDDESISSDSRVRAAATRAAMPSVEILGMVSVEESGQFVSLDSNNVPIYTWAYPKYMFFATDYSSQPSWPLVNLTNQAGTMAAYNASRAGGGNGPNSILIGDTGSDSSDEAVWALSPKVIIGNAGKTSAALDTWRSGYSSANYVNYNVSNYSSLEETVTNIAAASGDSTVVHNAALFNNYITRTFALTKAVKEQPCFALIAGVNSDGTYKLGTAGQNGTAANNRYLEVAADAGATNLYNLVSDPAAVPAKTVYDSDGNVTTYGLDYSSVILVGGQQSDTTYEAALDSLFDDELLDITYFTKDNANWGSSYGVVMNSIENAQNIGRILQTLYPEIVNEQDYLAYFYKYFYHINDDDLSHVMDRALDGVRNWNRTPVYDAANGYDTEWNIDHLTTWDQSECGFASSTAEATLNSRFAVSAS